MKLKSIDIGGKITANNVFLAPLAGYTDFAFRSLCATLGAGLTFTEMVSAKGIAYKNKGTKDLLYTYGNESVTAAQIFGSEPEFMKIAAESEELSPFDIIDINMGCPVPKIYNNGDGSALLNDAVLVEKIVKAVASAGKPVSVKIRLGTERGKCVATEIAKAAESGGAAMITVHGRYRPDYYSGQVDFAAIEDVKKSIKIPVIANGGIFTADDADEICDKSGADGVMLARGALQNPFLFSALTGTPANLTLKEFIVKHVTMLKEKFGDKYAAVNFRKIAPNYLKGVNCEKSKKTAFTKCASVDEILSLLDEIF